MIDPETKRILEAARKTVASWSEKDKSAFREHDRRIRSSEFQNRSHSSSQRCAACGKPAAEVSVSFQAEDRVEDICETCLALLIAWQGSLTVV